MLEVTGNMTIFKLPRTSHYKSLHSVARSLAKPLKSICAEMWICIMIQPLITREHTVLQLIPCLPHSGHEMDSTLSTGNFPICHLKMCFIQSEAPLPAATFKSFSENDTIDFLIRVMGFVETAIIQTS